MQGWVVPPPKKPEKGKEKLREEREEKVRWLIMHGFLRSERYFCINDAIESAAPVYPRITPPLFAFRYNTSPLTGAASHFFAVQFFV
ncbi:MAG: hypothetical protein M1497_01360 [Nitrospirae bacterium]|nr:hypothetical protein [Nitrospirota bacterium]